jgi:hypothetical protein
VHAGAIVNAAAKRNLMQVTLICGITPRPKRCCFTR